MILTIKILENTKASMLMESISMVIWRSVKGRERREIIKAHETSLFILKN